jgi:hypothetical protein
LLITALLVGFPTLTAVAVAVLPLPPLLLVLSHRWVHRLRRSHP